MNQNTPVLRLTAPLNMVFRPMAKLNMTPEDMITHFKSTAFDGMGFLIAKENEERFRLFTSRYIFFASLWTNRQSNPTGLCIYGMYDMTQSQTLQASLQGLPVMGLKESNLIAFNQQSVFCNSPVGMNQLLSRLEDYSCQRTDMARQAPPKDSLLRKRIRCFYDVQHSLIEAGQEYAKENALRLPYSAIREVTEANNDGTCYDLVVGKITDDKLRSKLKEGLCLRLPQTDEKFQRCSVEHYDIHTGTLRVVLREHDRNLLCPQGELQELPNPAFKFQTDALDKMRTDTAENPRLEQMVLGGAPLPIPQTVKYTPAEGVRLNEKQLEAVQKALNTQDYLLVQGPPGTGKTSIIIEMVRQFVEEGKRVLICSQNNHAVDNVLKKCLDLWHDEEKTKKIQVLRIGNLSKVEETLHGNLRRPLTQTIQNDMLERSRAVYEAKVEKRLKEDALIQEARPMVESCMNLYELAQEQIRTGEYIHDVACQLGWRRLIYPKLANELLLLSDLTCRGGQILARFFTRRLTLPIGEAVDDTYRAAVAEYKELPGGSLSAYADQTIHALLDAAPRRARWMLGDRLPWLLELVDDYFPRIVEYGKSLLSQQYKGNPLHPQMTAQDVEKGRAHFMERYDAIRSKRQAQILSLKESLEDWYNTLKRDNKAIGEALLQSVQIIGGTCIGTSTRSEFNNITYDVAIVDEAGQIAMHDLLVPLAKAKKVILIGDQVQLPPLEDSDFIKYYKKNYLNPLTAQLEANNPELDPKEMFYPFASEGDTFSKSLFEAMIRDERNKDHTVMLQTQYRMHSTIAGYISKQFYHGEYESVIEDEKMAMPIGSFQKPLYFFDTVDLADKGEQTFKKSYYNTKEAQICAKCVAEIIIEAKNGAPLAHSIYDKFGNFDIGVITAYGAQIEKIRAALVKELSATYGAQEAARLADMVQINTLDSFQGMENRVIVYSFVRSNSKDIADKEDNKVGEYHSVGFMNDVRRLNVLMTRAKSLLIMVGDSATLTGTNAKTKHDDKNAAEYYQALIDYCTEMGGYEKWKEDEQCK